MMNIFLSAIFSKIMYVDVILGVNDSLVPYAGVAALCAMISYISFAQMELYDVDMWNSKAHGQARICGGLAISFLLVLGLLYCLKISTIFSRGWMLSWFILAAASLGVARSMLIARLRSGAATGSWVRRKVILLGTRNYTSRVDRELRRTSPMDSVVAVFILGERQADHGIIDDLRQFLNRNEVDQIIICAPSQCLEHFRAAIGALAGYSAELLLCTLARPHQLPLRHEKLVGPFRLDVINPIPRYGRLLPFKHGLDLVVAALALLMLLPLLAVVAIAIKLDSPGPVFFRQRRYGLNNTIFRIIKFRTMRVTEDGKIVRQATRSDPRVTRVGRFLRRSSIDELPQLINVLLGDMSLVGPRPHAIAHDDDFEKRLDMFSLRRRVKPGITGWAQVNGFRGETCGEGLIEKRMEHDLCYIDNWSFWWDLEILVRTVFVVSKGAY